MKDEAIFPLVYKENRALEQVNRVCEIRQLGASGRCLNSEQEHSFTSSLPLKQINCSETVQPQGQPSVIPHTRNATSCCQIWNCVQGYTGNLGRRLRFLRSQWSQEGHEPLPGQVVNLPILWSSWCLLSREYCSGSQKFWLPVPALALFLRALGPGSSPMDHRFPFPFPRSWLPIYNYTFLVNNFF